MKAYNNIILKRLVIVTTWLLFGMIGMSAQTISNWTVKYDNNFNAVVKATVKKYN